MRRVLLMILAVILAFSQVQSLMHFPPASDADMWYFGLLSSPVLFASQLERENIEQPSVAPSPRNVQVTYDTNNMPQNEPSIAINPTNPSKLAVGGNDYRLTASGGPVWLGVYTSADGGLSWSNELVPGFPGDSKTTALSTFEFASDPAVAFDEAGNLYYSGLVFSLDGNGNPTDSSVFVAKSSNGELSFPQIALIGPEFERRFFNDKPYVAVDRARGRVYVSWTKFTFTAGTADIMVSYSEDAGVTFSSPRKVSSSPVNQGSLPVVGPSGELYVVWNDLRNDRIMVVRSDDGGFSFSSPILASNYSPLPNPLTNNSFRVNNFPTAAIDDTNGNLYVAWADYRSENADILFRRSIDGATTWGPLTKVNDDNTTHDQFFPWMSMASGKLSIAFYDRRLDPENHLVDVFYTQSSDGGVSFSENLRVSDGSFDPDTVLFGEVSFIGDYIGIASNGTTAHLVWADLRNVGPDSPRDQDIFTDRILTRPPNVNSIGPQGVDENQELVFTVSASDPDESQTLTLTSEWRPEGLPPGAAFNPSPSSTGTVAGTFTWTPDESQGETTYQIRFVASDGFFTDRKNVSITVNETNSPPILSVPQNEVVDEGSLLMFTALVSDSDTPPNEIIISISTLPEGATFDAVTGEFSWVPSEAQGPGNYFLSFTATDNGTPSRSETKTVNIHVNEVNLSPVLEIPPAQEVDEQKTLTFKVGAMDPDLLPNILTLLCENCLALGASFSPDGTVVWTPTEEQGNGDYTFLFSVTDDGAPPLSDIKSVRVHVREVNRPPTLSVESSYTATIGSTLIFTVRGSDPDIPVDSFTLSASGLVPGMNFDPLTGVFSFIPQENQTGTTFTISFAATEDRNPFLKTTRTINVRVVEVEIPESPARPGNLSDLVPWIGLAFVVGTAASLLLWKRNRKSHDN